MTGVPIAVLNGVVSVAREPDLGEVASFASTTNSAEVPWSLQVRGDQPSADLKALAAGYGLTERSSMPFMLKELSRPAGQQELDGGAAQNGPVKVRQVASESSDLYLDLLARGYEGPREVFAPFAAPAVMDHPQITTYLVELDCVPVATSVGVLADDHVGVFNITVVPEYRRQGYAG